jgi:hypothetical protein
MEHMPHLSPDRLAELADSEPTAAERQHLDACATCAAERAAHARVLTVAHLERERLMPPLVTWDTLSEQLRAEGLIKSPASTVRRRVWAVGTMRAAAALVLVVGGAAFGRFTAGVPLSGSVAARGAAEGTPVASDGATFRSIEEAAAVLNDAEQTYQRAAAFLAAKNVDSGRGESMQDYRRSLAALEEITGAARSAVYQAPGDPRVNQLYLQSLGAREQAIHQLANVLPVQTRLTSY